MKLKKLTYSRFFVFEVLAFFPTVYRQVYIFLASCMTHFNYWHGQKWRNLIFFHKMKINCWLKTNDLCLIIVKILHFWPCPQLKWVISCQNGKRYLQIIYILHCTRQTTRKLVKISKNVGGKIYSFLPWTQNLNWTLRPSFYTQVQIHVFGSTISKLLLILVPNRNCAQKSLELIWPIIEITSLKTLLHFGM